MPSDRPGPHPEPPADLASRGLPLVDLPGPWFRVHGEHHDPLYFGHSADGRFNAPNAEYGILYVGSDPHCAFIETFGQSTGVYTVTVGALAARAVSRIEARRPLRLVDLTGSGLARLGADERLCSGEHEVAQRWALALWAHPAKPDGLLYRARHDPLRHSARSSIGLQLSFNPLCREDGSPPPPESACRDPGYIWLCPRLGQSEHGRGCPMVVRLDGGETRRTRRGC